MDIFLLTLFLTNDSFQKRKEHLVVKFNKAIKIALALLEQEQPFKASNNGEKRQKAAQDDSYSEKSLNVKSHSNNRFFGGLRLSKVEDNCVGLSKVRFPIMSFLYIKLTTCHSETSPPAGGEA